MENVGEAQGWATLYHVLWRQVDALAMVIMWDHKVGRPREGLVVLIVFLVDPGADKFRVRHNQMKTDLPIPGAFHDLEMLGETIKGVMVCDNVVVKVVWALGRASVSGADPEEITM